MLLQAETSVLMVIDVQEKLCPVMEDPRLTLVNGARMMRGARALGVPILVTEQYPQGLGPTMFDLRELAQPGETLSKLTFDATGAPEILERLQAYRDQGRDQVVIIGTEAHVCVLQSAFGVKAAGFRPFVVTDACGSRRSESAVAAWRRLEAGGIALGIVEMVLFEWLGSKENPKFREIMQSLIR